METQAYGARGWCLAPGLNGVVSRVSRLGQAPRRNDLAAYVTTRVAWSRLQWARGQRRR